MKNLELSSLTLSLLEQFLGKEKATLIPYTSSSDHLLIVIDRKQIETGQLAQSCGNHNGGIYMLANSPSFP